MNEEEYKVAYEELRKKYNDRAVKSIAFNLKKLYDVKLLAFIEIDPLTNQLRDFSDYVRKLVEEDYNRHYNVSSMLAPHSTNSTQEIKNDINDEEKEDMKSFL